MNDENSNNTNTDNKDKNNAIDSQKTRWSGQETDAMKAAGSSLLYNQEIFAPSFERYFELLPSVPSVPMVIAGRCAMLPENYQDFKTLYQPSSNDNCCWPDVSAMMLCPICGSSHDIPVAGDSTAHEYWMAWYPLFALQNDNTVRLRVMARLVCYKCMETILEDSEVICSQGTRLKVRLPSHQTLQEAGSLTLLDKSMGKHDEILSAWNLYKYWDVHHLADLADYFKVPHKVADLSFVREQSCHSCGNRHQQDNSNDCLLAYKCYKCGVYFCSNCDRSHECMVIPNSRNKSYECDNCGKLSDLLRKCACNATIYCSVDCQRQHYRIHKFQCQNNKS